MHLQKYGFVYVAENKINNKKYVGKTEKLVGDRLKEHLRLSKKSKMIFHKALAKYGIENFKITYFKVPIDNLNEKEIESIKKLRAKAPFGYNMKMEEMAQSFLVKITACTEKN
jgi:group I intron endonuclease